MDQHIEQRFAQLLTEGVHRIRLRTSKTIRIVQDELGCVLGKKGGASIEYWRKGHLPATPSDIENLAREVVRRGGMDRNWLEEFLVSANYRHAEALCAELFSGSASIDSSAVLPDENDPSGSYNPFSIGPPILHPNRFFGRTDELKYLFGLWKHLPLQHVALLGLRRTGKTSLLHYLRQITMAPKAYLRPDQRPDWLSLPEPYQWVFVDFQDARMASQERLLRHLLSGLNLPLPATCDLANFMDIVSQHLRRPSIILMDELSAALASDELDQRFWWGLRSLVSNHTGGRLGIVLSSHEPPEQLADARDKPSPFFNIFGHTLTLGPLQAAEARELIASSPRPFDPADTNWILAESGRWPCLLQVLCHACFRALENGESGPAWKQEALRQIEPYRYLFDAV